MARKKKTLKVLRAEKDLTRIEASELIGVHYQTWRNWELGKTKPNMEQVEKICNAFNVKFEELKL